MSAAETRLWVETPDGGPPAVELPRTGVVTVGSDASRAELCLAGEGVAPVHCAIGRTKGGGWAVKDLGSPQGTQLNGARVEAARLSAGDELVLGSRRLCVVTRPGEARAREAAARDASAPMPRIPGYRVLRRLGSGAMGQVWLAVQQSLEREVALKVLAADVEADRAFVERFQAEARAAAALNHPNVVTVYDVGESGGLHYLSMEYMDAGNLEERVAKSGPLAWEEVVRCLRDAASGLVYAESKGIVHRDLKPANLMQNHAGTTKIADLGIATRADVESEEGGRKILGTPHFMAPEQVRGERLDSRTDLYALGATAYRLLSGRTPFEGASTRELLRAQLRDEPEPLLARAPGTPPALAELVQRLLAKDPAQRPPSASALVRALDELARPQLAAPRARSSGAFVALVLLALVGAAAAAWFLLPREEPAHATEPRLSAPAPPPPPAPLEAPPSIEESRTAAEDDAALKLREAEARLALVELERAEPEAPEQLARLRALAERFAGTAAASEAHLRAETLERDSRRAQASAEQHAQALATWSARLAEVLAQGEERAPDESLAALSALSAPPELGEDALAARASARRTLLETARERARAALAEAERRAQRGDFAGAASLLEGLPARLALPPELAEPAADEPLAEPARALSALAARAREELAGLDARRAEWRAEQAREDARALASALRAGAGLTRELRGLELDAARARVRGALESLRAADARELATALAADLERAQGALATLGREFSGVGWRRRTVGDPRDKRGSSVEALGADADGVLLPGPGATPEKVPWSAYGADVRELHRLFNDRLTRPWSAEEQRAIATLMRLASVAEAAGVLAPVLAPEGRANASERELRALEESFESARGWSADGESRERLAREQEALRRLLEVAALAAGGAPASAAARLEHLLADYGDTLLVRLCSDGSGLFVREPLVFQPLPSAREPASGESENAADESGAAGEGKDESREGARRERR